MDQTTNLQTATLGTGCFWCTEAIFAALEGVESAISGYAGGHVENPTYEQVCGKMTGHAECIQITFDSKVITYEELLEVFWKVHNPTTPNQQGNDKGPQYHSTVFYHNAEQKAVYEASLNAVVASGIWPDPIVTTLKPLDVFYPAEDYHQKYLERVGDSNSYCVYVVRPKFEKFKKEFKDRLKG